MTKPKAKSATETPEGTSSSTVVSSASGTSQLPLARVKRIIKEDKDVNMVNSDAAFLISFATELFIEYLVGESYQQAARQKRRGISYKDLATVVQEIDAFEFLEDVIPPTISFRKATEMRREALQKNADELESNGEDGFAEQSGRGDEDEEMADT